MAKIHVELFFLPFSCFVSSKYLSLHRTLHYSKQTKDMKRYKDLFIDFDDTLYDTHGNAKLALAELFDDLNLGRYFKCLEDFSVPYWQTNVELWGQYARGLIDRPYLIVERFRRPLACGFVSPGVPFEPTKEYCLEVSDHFLDLCANKPGVVQGAHDLVKYLRAQGYGLHLCSNGFHEVQYRKLRASGMEEFFDNIILSEDAGANKPLRAYFDYAMAKTGAKVETTLMIGDTFDTDILGAKAYGLDVMFFNRNPRTFHPSEPVNYEVHSLREIQNIL